MRLDMLESVGRYEIVGDLGAGAMSKVYLAHDPNLDRKLALKVVLQGWSVNRQEQSELERRFLLEARAHSESMAAALLSIAIACTSTCLAFGLLAASSFPALRALGMTTGLGVLASLILAPTALLLARGGERAP